MIHNGGVGENRCYHHFISTVVLAPRRRPRRGWQATADDTDPQGEPSHRDSGDLVGFPRTKP